MPKITLSHVLLRNKTNLKKFISKNNINDYSQLVEYCKSRNMLPVSEEDYLKVSIVSDIKEKDLKDTINLQDVNELDKKQNETISTKTQSSKSKTKRQSSTSQKKRTRRNSSKKASNT